MNNFTIDRSKKVFVLENGEEIPIPKDRQKEVLRTPYAKKLKEEKKEGLKKFEDIDSNSLLSILNPLKATGKSISETLTATKLGSDIGGYIESAIRGISPGEGQEQLGFLDRITDNFYAIQDAQKEISQERQQAHPVASMIGKGLGIAGDIKTLSNIPGVAAVPLIGATHSETSFLEPSEKLPELSSDAIIGLVLDKFFGGISKISSARGQKRTIEQAAKDIEAANISAQEQANLQNIAQGKTFASQKSAQEAYLNTLKGTQAQNEALFSQNVLNNIEKISKTMGKEKIHPEALGIPEFIEQNITRSALAGTSEGKRVENLLKSLFSPDKEGLISGDILKRGFNAIEQTIKKEPGLVSDTLLNFKDFVAKNMPQKAANSLAYAKFSPKLMNPVLKQVENLVDSALKIDKSAHANLLQKVKKSTINDFSTSIKNNIESTFEQFKGNLPEALANGDFEKFLKDSISSDKNFIKLKDIIGQLSEQEVKKLYKNFPLSVGKNMNPQFITKAREPFTLLENAINEIPSKISNKIYESYVQVFPDLGLYISQKLGTIEPSLQKSLGKASQIPLPAPLAAPSPILPTIESIPTLPPAENIYQKLAYGLENFKLGDFGKSVKENANLGILGSLAGLPVKKSLAAAGSVLTGAKALTSPSGLGGLISKIPYQAQKLSQPTQTVLKLAEKFPSLQPNGVLLDLGERALLAKEIENLQFSLLDKAELQTKVRRGMPLLK